MNKMEQQIEVIKMAMEYGDFLINLDPKTLDVVFAAAQVVMNDYQKSKLLQQKDEIEQKLAAISATEVLNEPI